VQDRILLYLRQKPFDGSQQFCKSKRLGEEGDLPFSYFVQWWLLGADEQSGDLFHMVKGMELVVQLQAGHIWKTIIENKEMRRVDANSLQCVEAGRVTMCVMRCLFLNHLNDELTDVRIVIDDKNELSASLPGSPKHVRLICHDKGSFFTLRSTSCWVVKMTRQAMRKGFTRAVRGMEVFYGA
jgi:hypothetical protein